MIPIIENLLTEIIETRLKYIKTNPDIVDRIFSQATVTMRSRLKEYVTSGTLKVVRGFPNDRASLPCFAIMLGGEREQEKSLGSLFSGEDDEDYTTSSAIEQAIVTRKDKRLVIQIKNKPIELINSITLSGSQVSFELINEKLGYIAVDEEDGVEFGDTVEVSYSYRVGGMESYGSLFNTQYRVETWTNNGDLTVMLYHLLKWILLSARDYMEEQGLSLQTLGGLDFEPVPEYFPELVYRRALTFECLTENSFGVEFGYIQGFEVNGKLGEE